MKINENTLGPQRASEVIGMWGSVGWPLRPSEDTQKSCGERESVKKSLNLGN